MSDVDDRAALALVIHRSIFGGDAHLGVCGGVCFKEADAVWAAGWRPNTDTSEHDAWNACADETFACGWTHEYARDDMKARNPYAAPVVGDAGPPPTDDELRSDDDERQADIQRDTQRGW